ncbi:MAG TPA: alpha/beta hydrolase [Thermoanaerobaculia bacterium]|nr:alpha/beta hydrolase [Thermoanaerobaculia bacterium]
MRSSRFLTATGAIAAGAAALAHAVYRKDLDAARRRIAEGRIIDAGHGPVEFAESGDGPPALVIHGAGGGFDQGLELGRALLGDGYRVIAPSRFGYLGTPLPTDASAEAQADAHLWLLDALRLGTLPVIGVSAGAPSALQLCLKYPERCSALVLVVPLAWAPDCSTAAPSPFFETVLDAITASDFLYWAATRVARLTLLKTILGTPVSDYRYAMPEERRNVDRVLASILPISRRAAGIRNDSAVSVNLTRYALENLRVPTLVISAADDLYGTCERGRYTAEQVPGAQFVRFPTGGHLLLGHDTEARGLIGRFLTEHAEAMERRVTAG